MSVAEERALNVDHLMAPGVGERLQRALQDVLDLQEAYSRQLVVVGKLRADWESEHQRAEHYRALYEENLAFQKQMTDWLRRLPDGR